MLVYVVMYPNMSLKKSESFNMQHFPGFEVRIWRFLMSPFYMRPNACSDWNGNDVLSGSKDTSIMVEKKGK